MWSILSWGVWLPALRSFAPVSLTLVSWSPKHGILTQAMGSSACGTRGMCDAGWSGLDGAAIGGAGETALSVSCPGEKPQRIFEDLQGSLKICKDLQKIFEDEDLSRILKGSLKDLWRSSLGKSWCKDPQGSSEDLVRILQGSLWQSGLPSWWGSFRILNNSLRIFQGS